MASPDPIRRCVDAIEAWEERVHAWVSVDPDRAAATPAIAGPLAGLVFGVKDVFDTADFPTEYGCRLYEGHRPAADAGVVALVRAAGGIVLGKTVTAELATYHPGPTANPHRVTHTPGGSSSGSAAAVATGMADVAFGTQTAGSLVRPASFCGVFGFKPTFGTVTVSGVKLVAPSLDTVGWMARDVATIDEVRRVLTGGPPARGHHADPIRIALVRPDEWDLAGADAQRAVEDAAVRAAAGGAIVSEPGWPSAFDGLASEHPVLMAFEAARSLAFEHRFHPDQLSAELVGMLDWGASVDPGEVVHIRRRARAVDVETLFGGADVLLTLAVRGEAPEGLEATGDPRFARLWTLLGLPAITVPGQTGATGLPIGVQLVARRYDDARLLDAAAWLAGVLPRPLAPGDREDSDHG